MTTTPIASFLAGSLLSILLPLAVLMALVVWYALFLRRAPDAERGRSGPNAGGAGSAAVPPTPPTTGATPPAEQTGSGEASSGGGHPAR